MDRFGAVVFPLARNLVEHPEKLVCEICWEEMFVEFSFLRSCYTTAQSVVFFTFLSLSGHHFLLGNNRKTLNEKRMQTERKFLIMAFGIVLGFAVC